jgi:hypothetical protein
LLAGSACSSQGSKSKVAAPESLFPTTERERSQLSLTACSGIQQPTHANDRQEDYSYVCKPFILSSEDTAFVLIDAWDRKGRMQSKKWKRGAALLRAMRKNNFYVVHAPAEAALEYKKYKRFRAEVKNHLGEDYCRGAYNFGNSNRQEVYNYGRVWDTNCLGNRPFPNPVQKILPSMAPDEAREKEYLVFNEDDVRYFLWKHKIKNLVYIGAALDQCVLRRPMGLNRLTGTDDYFMDLNIFLVEDVLGYMPNLTEKLTNEERNEALLKSLSFMTAKITRSDSFRFEDPPSPKR